MGRGLQYFVGDAQISAVNPSDVTSREFRGASGFLTSDAFPTRMLERAGSGRKPPVVGWFGEILLFLHSSGKPLL